MDTQRSDEVFVKREERTVVRACFGQRAKHHQQHPNKDENMRPNHDLNVAEAEFRGKWTEEGPGIIFDAALMELAHLEPGDDVNVEVHEGSRSRPFCSRPSREQVSKVIKSTMKDYARTMKKLARRW